MTNSLPLQKRFYAATYCLDEGAITTTLLDRTTFTLKLCEIIKGKSGKTQNSEQIEECSYIETHKVGEFEIKKINLLKVSETVTGGVNKASTK